MEERTVKGVRKLKCPRCGVWAKEDDFYWRSDGSVFTHKPCEKLRQQDRAAAKSKTAKKSAKPKAAAKKKAAKR